MQDLFLLLAQAETDVADGGGGGGIWEKILTIIENPWVKAILIFIIGYIVAVIARKIVEFILGKTTIDDKLAKLLGKDSAGSEKAVGLFVFFGIILVALIMGLKEAGQDDMVESLNGMLKQFLDFIPKLLVAAILGLVTFVIAKVVKELLLALLSAASVDERLGTGEAKPIANAVGLFAFFGIILIMLPQVLSALEMKAVSDPIKSLVDQIFDYIPKVVGGVILLAIGYLIASIVRQLLAAGLNAAGADNLPSKLGAEKDEIAGQSLSNLVGIVAMITILITVAAQAITIMDLGFISELATNMVPAYYDILVAVIIFSVAVFVANFLSKLVPNEFWAKVVRIGVIVFLGAVALQKANISDLTNETFETAIKALIIAGAFAVGVGGAIAFGLGGREKAKSWLDKR